MAGDANYNSVVLLLHCDGTNGSTTFTDNSPTPKTVTRAGDAQISTAQSQFGGASGLFDGTGDYLTTPDSNDFDFGTGDFTVECWASFAAHTTIIALITNYLNGSTGWTFQYDGTTSQLRLANGGTALINASWTPTDGVWYHLAACRSGTDLRLFVDGTQAGTTATSSTSLSGSTSMLSVGALFAGTWQQLFNGYIDDLRITKGYARYTANFTRPTAAFPDYAGQVSGLVRDSSNALCARTVRAYDRSTGALVASTTSNGTTGAYTLNCPTLNEVSVLFLDDVAGTTENDLVLRTTPG